MHRGPSKRERRLASRHVQLRGSDYYPLVQLRLWKPLIALDLWTAETDGSLWATSCGMPAIRCCHIHWCSASAEDVLLGCWRRFLHLVPKARWVAMAGMMVAGTVAAGHGGGGHGAGGLEVQTGAEEGGSERGCYKYGGAERR